MDRQSVSRDQLLGGLPPAATDDFWPRIDELLCRLQRRVIVLDDDPTGTQTVHDIPVVTRWTVEHLSRVLADSAATSYVLTNTRSLVEARAVSLTREIAANLRAAAAATGRDFAVVSRSDSTLRGHFPAEVETLQRELGQSFDAWVLCPFFEDGGRLTIGDVHYVAEGDTLTPAAATPFAADPAFGYANSNLRRWVEEKSGGRIRGNRVRSLSIEELRSEDPSEIARKLQQLPPRSVCIINAAVFSDLQAAVCGLLEAETAGKRFLYRTAASFVAARAGIRRRPLLERDELHCGEGRGVLVIAGSHVPKTTSQLDFLFEHLRPAAYELEVPRLLDEATRARDVAELARRASERLSGRPKTTSIVSGISV